MRHVSFEYISDIHTMTPLLIIILVCEYHDTEAQHDARDVRRDGASGARRDFEETEYIYGKGKLGDYEPSG